MLILGNVTVMFDVIIGFCPNPIKRCTAGRRTSAEGKDEGFCGRRAVGAELMNATMRKFGYPETSIKELERWVVLLRPQQVTLGALVLACKEQATALSATSPEAFTELHHVITQVERALRAAFVYDKINYLLLMMVDPDVHFHVLPRYAQERAFQGQTFHDHAWPGPPDFSRVNQTNQEITCAILAHLKLFF